MNITRLAKVSLATATLGSFLLFAGAPVLRAADDDACRGRIVKADHNLHVVTS